MNEKLKSFCDYIKPPSSYSNQCDQVVAEIFHLLKTSSSFSVTHCVLGGGLPSAKNTSTCLKADADMTVFVCWPISMNSTWIPLKKELVLDDWWRILFQNTTPDHPDDIIQRTANSLHFYYQGVWIDLLLGFQFHPDPARHRTCVLSILRVAHRVVQTKYREDEMTRLIKCLGSELTGDGVRWMRSKSQFVMDIARLAKFWSQTVLYNGCGNGKSFFVELVAVSVAMEEEEGVEENTMLGQISPKYCSAFERFLRTMMNMEKLRIIFLDVYCEKDILSSLLQQTPLLLNPVNPFQNMFECIDTDYVNLVTCAAKVTLKKLHSGSEDLADLFHPQNCDNLYSKINLRSHCWDIVDSVSTADLMPTVKFNCNWIKPALNRSKEKISKDIYKDTRYLMERVLRLLAAVQITTECSQPEFLLMNVIENLQSFCTELTHSRVHLRYLPSATVGEVMSRDVVFTLPCSGRTRCLLLGFDVIIPWM
eukprot:GFUD01018732.1.p1 GENE.GFUD01018732.1~~GFUD01018732.1.p1  ORF type:complete len:479 (+),score=114.93 GFUD01018732.1:52-1488(+)